MGSGAASLRPHLQRFRCRGQGVDVGGFWCGVVTITSETKPQEWTTCSLQVVHPRASI